MIGFAIVDRHLGAQSVSGEGTTGNAAQLACHTRRRSGEEVIAFAHEFAHTLTTGAVSASLLVVDKIHAG